MPPSNSQSAAFHFARMGNLQVLILDTDIRAAQQTRKVLSTLGINKTSLARDGAEAMARITENSVDILVTEWDAKSIKGVDLAYQVRDPSATHDPTLPIIMLSGRYSEENHKIAIDAGVNEFMSKSVSARTMFDVFLSVIDSPRSFIISSSYRGPDRRRVNSTLPPGMMVVNERKTMPQVIPRSRLHEPLEDNYPRMMLPDFALKKKLEAVPTEMAGIESLLAPVQAEKQKEDFVQWILNDITILKTSLKNIQAQPRQASHYVDRMLTATKTIQQRSTSSGYVLGGAIAKQLNNFCQKHFQKENPNHLRVMEKHVETLHAIFSARLMGEGGKIGEELSKELDILIQKYL